TRAGMMSRGNVSLYNETLDGDGNPTPIYPTPVVGMVGLLADVTQACGQGWRQAGDAIYLLGLGLTEAVTAPDLVTLGGSEYLAVIHNTVAGRPPRIEVEREQRVQAACRHGIHQGWIQSAHDCAEGGLAVALAESCISGQAGAQIEGAIAADSVRWDRLLFGEGGARIVVSVAPEAISDWEAYLAANLAGNWQAIGTVGEAGSSLQVVVDEHTVIDADLSDITSVWATAIERRLADAG
ncbi:MAG: AIR synthase-related protein, partial [Cyanobacteria bacterium J06607_6]